MTMFFRGFYSIVCSASAAQWQYEHHHVNHISVLACLLLISQAKLKVFVICWSRNTCRTYNVPYLRRANNCFDLLY